MFAKKQPGQLRQRLAEVRYISEIVENTFIAVWKWHDSILKVIAAKLVLMWVNTKFSFYIKIY